MQVVDLPLNPVILLEPESGTDFRDHSHAFLLENSPLHADQQAGTSSFP